MRAFTILIIAAALLACIICSDANASGQFSEQNKLGALVGGIGVNLDQCQYNIKMCNEIVGEIQKEQEDKRLETKTTIQNLCQTWLSSFPTVKDTVCTRAVTLIVDLLTNLNGDIPDPESRCSEERCCKN